MAGFWAKTVALWLAFVLPNRSGAQLHDEYFHDRLNDAENSNNFTGIYWLKQGPVKGLVIEPRGGSGLGKVEVFLGIPYAEPPVGSLRFMPPVSARHWNGNKTATIFAPVCPQTLPDLSTDNFSAGRYNYMKRLLPFLTNQSEDCLYLNLYVPYSGKTPPKLSHPSAHQPNQKDDRKKGYPVMIFFHGESFEWNSGNPYDGTVLAAYGKIIVITFNFRLGILGFLKPSLTEDTVGNYGLLDQIALLTWVKENIAQFNGDPDAVTLVGHGTGAACVNFLMVSPLASRGLFHRAILMSGSALSDWSLTTNPIVYTLQAAQSLNCPTSSEYFTECLRKKKLSDIMAVRVLFKKYTTPFGPIVDHLVIPNEPSLVMGVYKDIFSSYNLMYGCTEMESYHLLGARELVYGMLESERNELLRQYTQAKFEYRPDMAWAEILKEYAVFQTDPRRSAADTHRDTILDVLSDAQVTAPLVKTANFHSKANPNSYFYVFGHNSQAGEYAALSKSVHGEELAYLFGVPLGANKNHFREEYSAQERLLSETLMTYWTNFAKTGNPNMPRNRTYVSYGAKDWSKYDVIWPQYNHQTQSYLYLGIPPMLKYRYRTTHMKFWNENLPSILNHTKNPLYDFGDVIPMKTTQRPPRYREPPDWFNPPAQKPPMFGVQKLPTFLDGDKFGHLSRNPRPLPEVKPSREDPYKALKEMEKPNRPIDPGFVDGLRRWTMQKESLQPTVISPTTDGQIIKNKDADDMIQKSAMTMNVIIAVGVLFLLINLCAFTLLYYKKSRLKNREREIKRINAVNGDFPDIDDNVYDKEIKEEKSGCSVFKSLKSAKKRKSDDIYEPVKNHLYEGCKTPKSDDSGGFGQRFKLRRQMSSSTLDAHTKVRDWIAHEIVHRCSPNFLRKTSDTIKEQDPKLMANGTVINLPVINDRPPLDLPKPNCKIGSLTGSLRATTNSTVSIGAQEKQIKLTELKESDEGERKQKNKKGSGASSKPSNQSSSSKSTKSKRSNDKLTADGSLRREKPQKVSVAVDATPATRSESVLKQEPIELSKSLDYCFYDDRFERPSSPLRRSQTMEDIIKRASQESLNGSKENVFKSTVNLKVSPLSGADKPPEIIQIYHKHSKSDPVKDINYEEMFNERRYKPGSFNTFNTIQPPVAFRNDISVTCRDEPKARMMTPAEALMTIKRRNFPKVLPDLPKPGESMPTLAQKRLSLPPQSHLLFLTNSETSSPSNSELGSPTELKSFSRGPPIPPPRSSSTLGRNTPRNERFNSFEPGDSFDRSRTLDRSPNHHNYVEMQSSTLPNSARLNSNVNYKPPNRVNMLDIERSGSFSMSEQSESEIDEDTRKDNYEVIRPQPKLIISANPSDPKVNERKVIIKPVINKNPAKQTNIPRVLVRDNSFECDEKHKKVETVDPKRSNYARPSDVKIEIPVYRPDSKGPPTLEELERSKSVTEKSKEAPAKSEGKKVEKKAASKIPKTPVMASKNKRDQRVSPKNNRNKLQVKSAKNSSIPQLVASQKTGNEVQDIDNSASESSNDTECSAETVKRVK